MLARLDSQGFRNLAPLSWRLGPGRHLLLGGNGAGKTSLLEAVYVLATTRSFRTPRLADCVRHDAAAFRLAADVESESRVILEVGWGPGGLERAVNGRASGQAEHLAVLPVVAWTDAGKEALVGPPAGRRRLLDQGVVASHPAALEALGAYRRTLGQKRELLAGRGSAPALAAWNEVLADLASRVTEMRAAYAGRLAGAFEETARELFGEGPAVTLRYVPSCGPGREAILEALAAAAAEERQRRLPLIGPHRDDLEIRWEGREVRQAASAGERKALGLALLAARGRVLAEAGRPSIYLMDDADSELDRGRLRNAWRLFAGARQVIASSSRPEIWGGLDADRVWRIEGGKPLPDGAP